MKNLVIFVSKARVAINYSAGARTRLSGCFERKFQRCYRFYIPTNALILKMINKVNDLLQNATSLSQI